MTPASRSLPSLILFWWVLLFVMQQAERVFLLSDAIALEPPNMRTVLLTFLTGIRADFIVASIAILAALSMAGLLWTVWKMLTLHRYGSSLALRYRRGFVSSCVLIGTFILLALTIDMGYYGHNHRHLDVEFFEYVDDLTSDSREATLKASFDGDDSQALHQTRAELQETSKWGVRLLKFATVMGLCVMAWAFLFHRKMEPMLAHWQARHPATSVMVLAGTLLVSAFGFHPAGPWSIARASIPSSTFYMLAQNPIWYGADVFFASFAFKVSGSRANVEKLMPFPQALQVTRETLAPAGIFPFPKYPLVRRVSVNKASAAGTHPNIILLFIEGLDRRFLGKSVRPSSETASQWPSPAVLYRDGLNSRLLPADAPGAIRLTPFLDEFSHDAVYLENFFANGELTHHGLFASLCSQYSGYGRAAIKARYTYDYLCLPTLLKKAGYWTEMDIGHNRDHQQDHTALFLARNGLDYFFDETDFPPQAEQIGLGMTDEALFDFLRARIQNLTDQPRPFFLTALTLSSHHPYKVPLRDPHVRALAGDADPYLAALRYVDMQLGRWLQALRQDGLLKNTIVLILGDHGRHEGVGANDVERWLGHHATPLFIWLDPSLRSSTTYRPRTIPTTTSQVDLTPTILALAGASPRVSPFVGRDLSCLLSSLCIQDNTVLLSSNDMIAIAHAGKILLYELPSGGLRGAEIDLTKSGAPQLTDPMTAHRLKLLKGFFVSSSILLDENRLWSRDELAGSL